MTDLRSKASPKQFTPQGACFSVHGSAKQTLVFIHGVGMNQQVWQPQIDYFSEDYQVIAYDMFAQSDKVFVDRLPQLDKPVLYLTGTDDPNSTLWMSEQMARETPNGKSFAIEGEAHMMAYISPEKINPVIEQFIRENS